jgi:hypothetical protein
MTRPPTFRPQRKQTPDDITGQRFGLLTVLGPAQSTGTGARWRCRCECGQERYALGSQLRQKPPETHRNCRPGAGGEP